MPDAAVPLRRGRRTTAPAVRVGLEDVPAKM